MTEALKPFQGKGCMGSPEEGHLAQSPGLGLRLEAEKGKGGIKKGFGSPQTANDSRSPQVLSSVPAL